MLDAASHETGLPMWFQEKNSKLRFDSSKSRTRFPPLSTSNWRVYGNNSINVFPSLRDSYWVDKCGQALDSEMSSVDLAKQSGLFCCSLSASVLHSSLQHCWIWKWIFWTIWAVRHSASRLPAQCWDLHLGTICETHLKLLFFTPSIIFEIDAEAQLLSL